MTQQPPRLPPLPPWLPLVLLLAPSSSSIISAGLTDMCTTLGDSALN